MIRSKATCFRRLYRERKPDGRLAFEGGLESDLGDDPHERRHVITKANGGIVVFLVALAGRAAVVSLRPGVTTLRCALLVAIGGFALGVVRADRVLARAPFTVLGDGGLSHVRLLVLLCNDSWGNFLAASGTVFAAPLALAPVLAIVVLAAGTARRAFATARSIVLAFAGDHRRQVAVMPLDLGADQPFDGVDILGVRFGRDGEGFARAPARPVRPMRWT